MSLTSIIITAVAVYFLVLIIIAYKDNQKHDDQSFIIGGRKVGAIPIVSSITASFRDAGGVAIWVGTGFAIGYGYLSFMIGISIGFYALSLASPIIRKHSKKHNYITVGEMIKLRLGNKTSKITSVIVILSMVAMTSSQFFVLGNAVSAIVGIPAVISMVATGLVVGLYLYLGGFSTILKTDVVQFLIMVSFIVIVFFIPVRSEDILAINTLFYDKWTTFTLLIFGIIFPLYCADFYQKIFAAKNDKIIKKAIPWSIPMILISTASLIFLGMSARTLIPADTQMDLAVFDLIRLGVLPEWIIVFLSLVLISMAMSTIDTYAYVFSSTLLEDFKKIDIRKSKKKYIKYSRITMTIMLIASIAIAVNIEDFIKYLFATGALLAIVGPVFFGTSTGILPKGKKMDDLVACSTGISIIVFFILMFTTQYEFLPLNLVPFAVNLILIGISYFICKEKTQVDLTKIEKPAE